MIGAEINPMFCISRSRERDLQAKTMWIGVHAGGMAFLLRGHPHICTCKFPQRPSSTSQITRIVTENADCRGIFPGRNNFGKSIPGNVFAFSEGVWFNNHRPFFDCLINLHLFFSKELLRLTVRRLRIQLQIPV